MGDFYVRLFLIFVPEKNQINFLFPPFPCDAENFCLSYRTPFYIAVTTLTLNSM